MSIPAIFNRLDNPLTRMQGAFRKLQNFGPTALNPLAGGNASTMLGKVGQTINPLNPMNALGLGLEMVPGSVLPAKEKAALQGFLFTPGPAPLNVLGGLIGYDINNPLAGGTRAGAPKLTPAQIKRANQIRKEQGLPPLSSTGEVVSKFPSEDRLRGDRTIQQGGGRTGVDRSTTPTSDPRNTDLPVSAEQVAPVDPYAYQLSVYGQGRQAANSQEAMNKVRDLGLAINQAKYPQFYRESYNPLMAATFPERYQKTPENFVVQQGIQVPSAMTAKDSRAELLQSEEEANIERLDQSTAAVEAFLANYLNKGAR